jgi:hypothetical protein
MENQKTIIPKPTPFREGLLVIVPEYSTGAKNLTAPNNVNSMSASSS